MLLQKSSKLVDSFMFLVLVHDSNRSGEEDKEMFSFRSLGHDVVVSLILLVIQRLAEFLDFGLFHLQNVFKIRDIT